MKNDPKLDILDKQSQGSKPDISKFLFLGSELELNCELCILELHSKSAS